MAEREAQAGKRQPRGLTLVEMLAVIVIIALLMALLLPAVGSVREAARNAGCANNLKQFGIGMQNYEAAFNAFPPASTGFHGITFWALITNYIDDGAASAFGSRLHLGYPGKKITTKNNLPSALDAETIAISAQNELLLDTMPQFAFLICPTRGPRQKKGTVVNKLYGDYVMVASGTVLNPVKPQLFLDALCVPWDPIPGLEGKPGCGNLSSSAGHEILNIAIGRTRITPQQAAFWPSLAANWYTNMIDFYTVTVSDAGSIPADLRVQRPYGAWSSRVRPASVPDGLSNTAVLAEKHLAAWELGWNSQSGRRTPSTPTATDFGLDRIALVGLPEYRDIGHFTRGIAFGPSDGSSPYSGNVGDPKLGPTVGSWHPGSQVNVLMADGSVRSIGNDIDTMYMMPMLGTRNDTNIRTDGRVLSLP